MRFSLCGPCITAIIHTHSLTYTHKDRVCHTFSSHAVPVLLAETCNRNHLQWSKLHGPRKTEQTSSAKEAPTSKTNSWRSRQASSVSSDDTYISYCSLKPIYVCMIEGMGKCEWEWETGGEWQTFCVCVWEREHWISQEPSLINFYCILISLVLRNMKNQSTCYRILR